jgi:hypothetical protein
MTVLSELNPGDTFRLADGTRRRFILRAHREGNEMRRPYVDCIELDHLGQQWKWRCLRPELVVRLVKAAT